MTAAVRAIAVALLVAGFAFGILVAATYRAPASGLFCAPWPQLRAMLLKVFQETPVGGGPSADGKAATVMLAAPGGVTFSIVVIGPGGAACIVSGGKDWSSSPAPKAGERGT